MKVKVVSDFVDLQSKKKLRKAGEVFETSADRGNELLKNGFAIPIEEPKEKVKKESKEAAE